MHHGEARDFRVGLVASARGSMRLPTVDSLPLTWPNWTANSFLQFSRPIHQQGNGRGFGTLPGKHGETLAIRTDVV